MRHIRAVMLGVALIALVASCGGYLLVREIRTPAAESGAAIQIEITQGETTSQIASRLRSEGLIRQPLLFMLLARMQGFDNKLQAGRYVLAPTMTISQIFIALQNSRVEERQITIREGLRIEEVAAAVAASGVVSAEDFLRLARNGAAFRNRSILFNSIPQGATLEGYLFPDTYRIAATATVTEIIGLMLDRFDAQYRTFELEVRVPDVSVHQIVTMASIVQREAAREAEMPLIAAVFWNRLNPANAGETGGGKLQADPTVQYALGYSQSERTWWRKDLTVQELLIASPYNTREQAGLPPGPISGPGLAALRAAAQPDESANYLYFVADCAKDGSHHFAADFATFQTFEAQWLACQ